MPALVLGRLLLSQKESSRGIDLNCKAVLCLDRLDSADCYSREYLLSNCFEAVSGLLVISGVARVIYYLYSDL